MLKNNNIYNDIKQSLYKDDKAFEKLLKKIEKVEGRKNKYFWPMYDEFYFNIIKTINLNEKELVMFLIRATKKDYKSLSTSFKNFLISFFIYYINSNTDTLIEILADDKVQVDFTYWLRDCGTLISTSYTKNKKILDALKHKDILYTDESKILNSFSNNYAFFETLPLEYKHLIALYKYNKRDKNDDKIKALYEDIFKNKLKDSQILKLIKSHIQIYTDENILEINTQYRSYELIYCLKNILNDSKYFDNLEDLSNKSYLELKYIISLAAKYDKTNFFISLCNSKTSFDLETIKKIKYLATSPKIKTINNINNIEDISLNELINLEKENNIDINVQGGPHSSSFDFFDDNSLESEVRRINPDGACIIDEVVIGHVGSLKHIYEELKLNDKDVTSIEISSIAAKKLNTITFIIENEMCIIVLPNVITVAQKETCTNQINRAIDNSKFGIILYNLNTNQIEIISSNALGKEEAIQYISNIDNVKTL